MVTRYTLTIGDVLNNGVKCSTPIVEVVGTGDFTVSCIDAGAGTYLFEGILPENKCIDLLISCGECSDCPPKEIRKCVCDSDSECGSCETCGDSGFCETVCVDDFYCFEDKCVECDDSTPCPDGKECKSGRCVCPQNKPFLVGGKCLECIADEPCRECKNGVFVNKDCSGVCDPASNGCVDCLDTTDCDGENECCVGKSCDCCEGFSRDVSGNCVPTAECDGETPCPACKTCQDGNCEPIICPPGKICIGEEGCVEECDCNEPYACSDVTSSCFSSTEGCGCVQCKGDCNSGCSTGCYCNGTECVGDVCYGGKCPCTNGGDCPDGYGCDGTNCVPCASLDCDTSECSNILGCGCANDVCIDSDVACGNSPCVTSSDCAFGCACDDGVCKSCDNYSCAECGGITGCGCTGVLCEGADTTCADTFEITKDDTVCELTATLSKGEECACSPLTVDIKTKRNSIGGSGNYELSFLGEVRKGLYEGSLNTPLLDNLTNADIVENDSPTSGQITITSIGQYREYDVNPITGVRSTPTIVVEPAITATASFITGMVASIDLGSIEYNQLNTTIVTETDVQGRTTKEISYFRVDITAAITDDFDFPNECTYGQKTIGSYRMTNNSDFEAIGFAYGSHVATTITSPETRLPIFRWFKSGTDTISGDPFRKLYVPLTGNEYIDTITKADGLEACKFYKTITDCSCVASPDIKAVFCNPEDLLFNVTGCNKQLNISPTILIPCDVNQDIEFYFRAGSLYQTWLGSRWDVIAGNSFPSTTPITEVAFGQVCDTEGLCTKTYDVPFELDELTISVSPTCNANGLSGTFVVPTTDVDARCNITSMTIGGVTYIPGNNVTINTGTSTYSIVWACGCDETTGSVTFVCCENLDQDIIRYCGGTVSCNAITGVVYSVNGTVIADICAYVSALGRDVAVSIVAERSGCDSITIPIPAIQDQCCDNFDMILIDNGAGNIGVELFGEASTGTVLITRDDGMALANGEAISGGGGSRIFVNVDRSLSYTLSFVSTFNCGTVSKTVKATLIGPGTGTPEGPAPDDDLPPVTGGGVTNAMGVVANSDYESSQPIPSPCGQNTELYRFATGGTYTLRGEIDPVNCPCPSTSASFEITNVNDNVAQEAIDISYTTATTGGPGMSATLQDVVIRDVSRGVDYTVNPNETTTLTIPKSITTTTETIEVTVTYKHKRNSSAWPAGQLGRIDNLRLRDFGSAGFGGPRYDLSKVSSASATLTASTGTSGTFVGTVLANDIEFIPSYPFEGTGGFMIGDNPNRTVNIAITLTMITGEVETIIRNMPLYVEEGDNLDVGYNISQSFNVLVPEYTYTESDVLLQLVVNNLAAINDCRYSGSTSSITLDSTGVSSSTFVSTPLGAASNPAYTKFEWKEDGVVVATEYSNSIDQLDVAEADIGKTYLLTTTCGTCQEQQTLNLCPPISGTVTLDACLENVDFNISGDTGEIYDITFEGTTNAGVTLVAGTATTAFVEPLLENTVYTVAIALQGVAGCIATFNFSSGSKQVGCP